MAKTKKKKMQIKPGSIIAMVLCSCIVLFFGFLIAKEIVELKKNNDELTKEVNILESQSAENEALEKAISEGDEEAFAEEYARKNGYVMPDERVYVDITPGSEE